MQACVCVCVCVCVRVLDRSYFRTILFVRTIHFERGAIAARTRDRMEKFVSTLLLCTNLALNFLVSVVAATVRKVADDAAKAQLAHEEVRALAVRHLCNRPSKQHPSEYLKDARSCTSLAQERIRRKYDSAAARAVGNGRQRVCRLAPTIHARNSRNRSCWDGLPAAAFAAHAYPAPGESPASRVLPISARPHLTPQRSADIGRRVFRLAEATAAPQRRGNAARHSTFE
jgi:hypothetical protein